MTEQPDQPNQDEDDVNTGTAEGAAFGAGVKTEES